MSFWKRLFAPMVSMMRQPVESFIKLETTDDEYTVVGSDGSLITYLRVDGARQTGGRAGPGHQIIKCIQATFANGSG